MRPDAARAHAPAHAPAPMHTPTHAWRTRMGAIAQRAAPALALAAAVYLGFFLHLGSLPLFDVDEGAFGEATREMLARGDYVSTWLNGLPRFDKPILTYWLQAASVTAFGLDEFALRLPSALAACAWIAAIFAFGRRNARMDADHADQAEHAGRADAHAAAFIAATSIGVVVIGRGAIADALLNLFLALTMFDLIRYQADPRPSLRRRAFFWTGLGLLAKGPVALLIPVVAGALAFGLQRRLRDGWRALRDPAGWCILLAVAAPWYALETTRRGAAFLAGFFLHHNVERFTTPLQGHGGSVLYYVPPMLLLMLPYSGLLLSALATLKAPRRLLRDRVDLFLWCWFGFVLVFFSLAGTKLPHYLLAGATPLFVLMARRRTACANWLAFLPPLLFMAALSALPFALARFAPGIRNPYVREALSRSDAFDGRWLAGAGLLAGCVLCLAVARRLPLWPRLAAAGLACTYASVALLLPAVAHLQQAPVKEAALLARRNGWHVAAWRIDAPSFSVYRDAVTPRLPPGVVPPAGAIVLTRSDALNGLPVEQVLYRKGGVMLVRVGARDGHG